MKLRFMLIVSLLVMILLLIFSCEKNLTENKNTVPELETFEASKITNTAASTGISIISDGGSIINDCGICWSISQNPTIEDDTLRSKTCVDSINFMITDLTPGDTYYIRGYATNDIGTGYGQEISFTTTGESGTVTDIDGNVYTTVKIGDQWWMAENLKVTHYRNGDPIPVVTDTTEWLNLTTDAYCNFYNDENVSITYGSLYNWYAVDDSRNIAPEGWHVPSDEEWKRLEMYLGMSQSEADESGYRGTDQGSQLAGNADLWYDGDLVSNAAFGSSGFAVLPGGYRGYDGYFSIMGYGAYFWSSTETSSGYAWRRTLAYGYSDVARSGNNKRGGFSVRCVRD